MEPGVDYLGVYVRILAFIGIIAATLWYLYGGEKQPNVMVGMDVIGQSNN